jgi:hypothetical protein
VIVQRYSYRCDCPGCSTEYSDVTPTPIEDLRTFAPLPTLPRGWTLVGEHLVCPLHLVAVGGLPLDDAFSPDRASVRPIGL